MRAHSVAVVLRWEALAYAAPLLLACVVTHLVFWPAQINFDATMQWMEAMRGPPYTESLVVLVTLLMRALTFISPSPALMVGLQYVAAALAVGLILSQIRKLGVPRYAAAACAIFVAILPQNALMLTVLGKDALYAVGCLFLFGMLLRCVVMLDRRQLSWGTMGLLLLACLLVASVRFNGLVVGMVALFATVAGLLWRGRGRAGVLLLGAAFLCMLGLRTMTAMVQTEGASSRDMAFTYASHVIAAMIKGGAALAPEDVVLLERAMPLATWRDSYDCRMVDSTRAGFFAAHGGNADAAVRAISAHEQEFLILARNLIQHNVGLAWERQRCISRPIWHVGPTPVINLWDTTAPAAMVGIDGSIPETYAEHLRADSMIPSWFAPARDQVYFWTIPKQAGGLSWLLWNTAIPLYLSIAIVLWSWARRKDIRALYCYLPFLAHVAVMFLFLPYPAFRYQYPVFLIFPFILLFLWLPGRAVGQPTQSLREGGR